MPWAASAPRVEAPGISGARTHLAIRNRKVRGGITRGARCCPAGPFLPQRAGAQHRAPCVGVFSSVQPSAGLALRSTLLRQRPSFGRRRASRAQHHHGQHPRRHPGTGTAPGGPGRGSPSPAASLWLEPPGSRRRAQMRRHRHQPRGPGVPLGRDERDGGRHKPLPSPETDRGGGSAPPQAFLGRKREGGEITSERHVPRAGPGRDAHGGWGQLRAFLGAG